uniref:Uncharacterized protein n=1 Tax=Heterorhabditis bacteriophora TaxID=37862 RepID=A0A1I7WU51_HETBA
MTAEQKEEEERAKQKIVSIIDSVFSESARRSGKIENQFSHTTTSRETQNESEKEPPPKFIPYRIISVDNKSIPTNVITVQPLEPDSLLASTLKSDSLSSASNPGRRKRKNVVNSILETVPYSFHPNESDEEAEQSE